MASFGKKFLSAFVEVTDGEKAVTRPEEITDHSTQTVTERAVPAGTAEKFKQYFDKLFSDSNLPGPDYYEFAKMTQAMIGIADEKARYSAAFAGLGVQGLDKNKLLNSTAAYLKILETDAVSFNSTVDAAITEKVQARQQEIQNKQQRIEQLSAEISSLKDQIQLLQIEVNENEEKIENNTGGYKLCSEKMKQEILGDMEKIKQYIS